MGGSKRFSEREYSADGVGRERAKLGRISLIALLWAGVGVGQASAQSGEAPSLNDQMRDVLGVNHEFGCATNTEFSGDFGEGPVRDWTFLGPRLQAFCFSLVDTSANGGGSSALGGSLDSVQSTKTVSEFRAARRRIDQRLRNSRRPPPRRLAHNAYDDDPASDAPPLTVDAYEDDGSRFGVFGSLQWEQRDRAGTRLASAQDGHVVSGIVGFDHFWGNGAAGLYLTYSETDAAIHGSEPEVLHSLFSEHDGPSAIDEEFRDFLREGNNLARACGGATGDGEVNSESVGVGGFLGWAIGKTGFFDVGLSHARTESHYRRSVCVIKHGLTENQEGVPPIYFSDNGATPDQTGSAQRLWVIRRAEGPEISTWRPIAMPASSLDVRSSRKTACLRAAE